MNYGKIIEYDNYIGKIIDKEGIIYLFVNDDLKTFNINKNDFVSFVPELFKTVEIEEYRAHFIKKYNDNKKTINS